MITIIYHLHIYYNKNFLFYQIIISGCVLLLLFDKMVIRNTAVARCRTTLGIFTFSLGISTFNPLRFPVSPVSTSRSFMHSLFLTYILYQKFLKKSIMEHKLVQFHFSIELPQTYIAISLLHPRYQKPS